MDAQLIRKEPNKQLQLILMEVKEDVADYLQF